jgi:hypothetical protein
LWWGKSDKGCKSSIHYQQLFKKNHPAPPNGARRATPPRIDRCGRRDLRIKWRMTSTFIAWLKYLSRICGFDTADSFPPGHPYERTRWNGAYFDIASDVKPERMEQLLCEAIANTPLVFGYIHNPTPRMQRALFAILEERMRNNRGRAGELAALLIAAYDASPHVVEVLPGLRAEIAASRAQDGAERARSLMAFLHTMQSPFDVIEMRQ